MPLHDEYIKNIEYYREYSHSDKTLDIHRKACKKYGKSKKGNATLIAYNQSDKGKKVRSKANKKYRQTLHGKEMHIKHESIRTRRLNWIKLHSNPFDESIEVEWHHISDDLILAIPEDLHRLYYGKNHREMTMTIIKQIYLMGD